MRDGQEEKGRDTPTARKSEERERETETDRQTEGEGREGEREGGGERKPAGTIASTLFPVLLSMVEVGK